MKLWIKNHLNSKYYVLNVMGCYWPYCKRSQWSSYDTWTLIAWVKL